MYANHSIQVRGIEQTIARICAATTSVLVRGCAQADDRQSTVSAQLLHQPILLKCCLLNHASNDNDASWALEGTNVVDMLRNALTAVDHAVHKNDGFLIFDVLELDESRTRCMDKRRAGKNFV